MADFAGRRNRLTRVKAKQSPARESGGGQEAFVADRRTPSIGQAVIGAVCALAGSVALTAMFWAVNSRSEAWVFRLGLAPAALASAVAQGLVFYGVWQLWRAFRNNGPG